MPVAAVRPQAEKRKSLRCLILNADGRPLSTWPLSLIPAQDAVHALYRDRLSVLEEWPGEFFRSPSVEIAVPKTAMLKEYAPISGDPKFCRRSILLRDRFSCFVAGTRILMADGRQTPIEEVAVGDRVIDAFGMPVSVVRLGRRLADNCVSIKHRGSYERTVVTDDHPFLVDGGEFAAIKDIEITERRGGGMLRFPRHISYELAAPKAVNLAALLPEDVWYRARNGRIFRSRHTSASGMPAVVEQSPHLAYLLGLYVAEGSATKTGSIVFSFCSDEEGTLAVDAAELMKSVFGIKTWTRTSPERHTCVVGASCKTLAEVLWGQCGKGAKNKKTPWELIGPYHADYLRGLFLGDAHFDDVRRKIALTMTGFDAVWGAQSMLWGLGIYPTIQHNTIVGKQPILTIVLNAENRAKFMRVVMRESASDADEIFGDETHVFRRLQDCAPVDDDQIVYNFETDGSHTYIANGLSVHNCQYCGQRFESHELTYDHVIPRSKGGTTTWANIVSCCLACNSRKANSLPNYSGRKRVAAAGQMRPLKEPRRPSNAELLRAGLEFLDNSVKETWADVLYWGVSLEP